MQRVEEIRGALASIKDQTEDVINLFSVVWGETFF